MRIELAIEALIVDGLPVEDEAAFQAAVEAELGRLLAVQGVPAAWQAAGTIEALDAGTVGMNAGDSLGEQVARAVIGGANR
jgi:hypothetical protein